VGVQNGMTADTIAEVVGPERTMGCVLEISSAMFEPGVVTRDSPHDRSWFAVGSLAPSGKSREQEVADLLGFSGAVNVVDNIQATKWMKLVSNATTLVSTAILGLSIHEAAAIPEMRSLMVRSGQEALDTGAALGHPVLPIFGLKEADIRQTNRLVDTLLDVLLAGFTLPSTKTTVLQDWMKGRHSEVDDLNGLVAHLAESKGKRAPVNAAIAELARRIERGTLKPGAENLALLQSMS
jgi:2-dehydropantoate 2-reductase